MDATQRNGGTAGIVAAVLLALLFVLILSTGLDPQAMRDPARALPAFTKQQSLWAFVGIAGALASLAGTIFIIGLFGRLRDRAPTRASAMLYFGVIGLGGHALGALTHWQGGLQLANYAAKDQVAANHAWVALAATIGGINALGSTFTGASLIAAAWAVIAAGGLNPTVGWVAAIAGVLEILGVLATHPLVMLGGFVFVIIWLAWAGSELRRPPGRR